MRCQWRDPARCAEPWWKKQDFGEGKVMGFCEAHWESRYDQRPASREEYVEAMAKIKRAMSGASDGE